MVKQRKFIGLLFTPLPRHRRYHLEAPVQPETEESRIGSLRFGHGTPQHHGTGLLDDSDDLSRDPEDVQCGTRSDPFFYPGIGLIAAHFPEPRVAQG